MHKSQVSDYEEINKIKFVTKSDVTYSCSNILSGIRLLGTLHLLGKWVLLSISITSKFRLSSSPSFSPDAKWLQTKQKLVLYKSMLTAMQPCTQQKFDM